MKQNSVVRLALTLMIITAVSAGLLSYVHAITDEVKTERRLEQLQAAIAEFFPDAEEVAEEQISPHEFNLAKDSAGNLMGALASTRTNRGYGGEIRYTLALDGEGTILNISIDSHGETPGIGAKITEEPFQENIKGLNVNDPIALREDIDNISGATVTVAAMADSLRQVMDVYKENFVD